MRLLKLATQTIVLVAATTAQPCSLHVQSPNFAESGETSYLHVADLQSLRAHDTNADVVVRDGYAAIGDSPPVVYRYDIKPCPRADGGAQVSAKGGGCWVAFLDRSSPLAASIWGARCDDLTDDGAAFSNALFAVGALGGGRVFVPATGKGCRIGTGIEQTINGTGLVGNGDHNWGGPGGAKASWLAAGSWLDCADRAHSCVKFDAAGFIEGVNFWQDQPLPVAGWSPIAYPWAVEFLQNFSHTSNVFMADVYQGVYFHGRPGDKVYGSHNYFNDMYFGTFRVAVRMDSVNNTMTCNNVHVALEWQINGLGVQAFLNKYGIGFDFHYVDNLSCSNVEFYKVAQAMRFTNGAAAYGEATITHAAAHLAMSNVSFNLVPQAIAVASRDVVLSAQLQNVLAQTDTDTGMSARCFFDLQTAFADIDIYGFEGGGLGRSVGCLGVPGGHSKLKISDIDLRSSPFPHPQNSQVGDVSGYNYLGGGFPAFSIVKGSTVEISNGWQKVVPGNVSSGPRVQCAGHALPVEGECSLVVQPHP